MLEKLEEYFTLRKEKDKSMTLVGDSVSETTTEGYSEPYTKRIINW